MFKNFVFPDLEPDGKAEADEALPENEAAGSAEGRTPPISLGSEDIDIAQFPLMRAAFGLTEAEPQAENTDSDYDPIIEEALTGRDPRRKPAVPVPDSEPSEDPGEKEEPIPSLFAGIGRTDWSEPAPEPEQTEPGYPDILDYLGISIDADFPDAAGEDEDDEPAEVEPEISEYELLDLIDDIEFSDLGAEALKPVRIKQPDADPYYSAFNAGNEDTDEPDEMPHYPRYRFEKK